MASVIRGGSRICVIAMKCFDNTRRGIAGRAMREALKVPPRPPAFNWQEKEYNLWRSWFDRTTDRFDDNTKVIVVEGPIAAGKTNFAKQLAAELDMKHFEEATLDHIYINYYGNHRREIDHLIPESCRTFDHMDFCKNPHHINAASYQLMSYTSRYSQYIDALGHMLNSGQGVVLERSPYSDFVFADAMRAAGYMSKEAYSIYGDVRYTSICELIRPHLVIYLDIPVNVVKERVKQRNYPYEKDSVIFNDTYLQTMEKSYKEKYLKDIGEHALMLVYDWTGYGDIEVVVEDIEKLDFDCYGRWDDTKLKDYNLGHESEWTELRMQYSRLENKTIMLQSIAVPRLDAPELLISGQDMWEYNQVLKLTPGYRWAAGYDVELGDKVLFKAKQFKEWK